MTTASHDEYFSAFRQLRLSGFILDRAGRLWSLTRYRLSSCTLEHGVDAAPWAGVGSTSSGTFTFAFSGRPDARLRVDGREVSRDALCLWPGRARVSIVAHEPASWFVVSVAESELAALANLNGARGPGVKNGPRHVRPEELVRLRALASRLLEAAETAGSADFATKASASLERALLGELSRLATDPRPAPPSGSPRIDRRAVLERFEEFLDARPSEPIYVADLCAATGLPERTLRFILVEQYGESPIRLLRSRRLCQLHRVLQAEEEAGESLARLAERHGFRHMGALAADYRNLFGELPSETRRDIGGFAPAPARFRATDPPREGFGRLSDLAVAIATGPTGR